MLELLWLIPAFPLAGFVVLALCGGKLPRAAASVIGAGSVGAAAVVSCLLGSAFIQDPPQEHAFVQHLWTWMRVGTFAPAVALRLDALSLVMTLVVTGVGFLIHLYSTEYMRDDKGYSRFFAYMNLFVSMMLILVLADNLALLYLGWEGVGLCSYLLIGFWHEDPANGAAARKAFIVTRVGDTAMALGLFLLFAQLGTLDIQEMMRRAAAQWPAGSGLAVAAAALLLVGALGKSAQLPLQTWLPDAMAGPTPVSALIHAATMVTAGVYLIARTNVLFTLAPTVQLLVAIIGAVTLLMAGCSALVQTDIKRVLAYSTISQIGYMFLALGVGAWSAAIFHFMTHAFFKALLFLGAGAVIISLHHEQNIFKMGGLRRQMPFVFWTFLIGASSLSALPFVTAGFYSKDAILWEAFAGKEVGTFLAVAGLVGAWLTALYTFRMVFIVFFGEAKAKTTHAPGPAICVPLGVLAVLSIVGGFVAMPPILAKFEPLRHLLHGILPKAETVTAASGREWQLMLISSFLSLVGLFRAYQLYMPRGARAEALPQKSWESRIRRWWFADWGLDWLYDRLFVAPFVWMARINRGDAVDWIYRGAARLSIAMHCTLRLTQTGQLRWYAFCIALGAAIILGMVALL
ncbi:MAG: NADH-quinone oxidoreductase subunit L [Candidatus Sumerlaeota bacterium]|nr:NADH-quinone oxidoreductase subunit L [Candidatus Sumerlaeota bacterium]